MLSLLEGTGMHRNTNTRLEEWASLVGDELPEDVEHAVSGRREESRASDPPWAGRTDQ